MDKERVILLVYHGKGHFNATLAIAKILDEQYDVIFAGFPAFRNYIEGQGFPYFPLNTLPFGLGFEQWLNIQEKKRWRLWHVMKDRLTDRLYDLREQELSLMTATIKPEYILIDSWQSTDLIVLYPFLKGRNVKVGFLQTMLPTRISEGKPPLNSAADITNHMILKQALDEASKRKQKKIWLDKLRYMGMDTVTMIRRRIRLNNFPEKYVTNEDAVFAPAFNLVPEFILSSHEFDYPNIDPLPHQHFVGPFVDHTRIETVDEKWTIHEPEILRLSQARPLIYCSFGSLPLEREITAIENLVNGLARLVKKNNYVCIISSGNRKISGREKPTDADMFYFGQVPQLSVLQHARLFITHGGLNSIKEGIDAGVPMLVYPVSKEYDLPGNGARITYHSLGMMLDAEAFDESKFENAVSELLTNDVYKRNIEAFRKSGRKYTPENFMNLFLGLTPLD